MPNHHIFLVEGYIVGVCCKIGWSINRSYSGSSYHEANRGPRYNACHTLFYSNDNVCLAITRDSVSISNDLSSNQEEADPKLVLHTFHALKYDPNGRVIVKNHSGDVDNTVIIIAIITVKE